MSGKVALLTGFEPYGGRGVNPAFEIMQRLDGMAIGNTKVAGRPLPVSYEALSAKIDELLEELDPALVVSVGLWPGEPMIRLERIAINMADFEKDRKRTSRQGLGSNSDESGSRLLLDAGIGPQE